jgi:hypothetical protein
MNALEKNIAVARGEAMAASLLASAALQTALLLVPNRAELLARISAFIDDTLNLSGPGKGDANDELNTLMRETARFQAMQNLDGIASPSGNDASGFRFRLLHRSALFSFSIARVPPRVAPREGPVTDACPTNDLPQRVSLRCPFWVCLPSLVRHAET